LLCGSNMGGRFYDRYDFVTKTRSRVKVMLCLDGIWRLEENSTEEQDPSISCDLVSNLCTKRVRAYKEIIPKQFEQDQTFHEPMHIAAMGAQCIFRLAQQSFVRNSLSSSILFERPIFRFRLRRRKVIYLDSLLFVSIRSSSKCRHLKIRRVMSKSNAM